MSYSREFARKVLARRPLARPSTAFESRPPGDVYEVPSPGDQVSILAARLEKELGPEPDETPRNRGLSGATLVGMELVVHTSDGRQVSLGFQSLDNVFLTPGSHVQFEGWGLDL